MPNNVWTQIRFLKKITKPPHIAQKQAKSTIWAKDGHYADFL
jgi:hypothetical protein